MANNKDNPNKGSKPANNTNSQPLPEEFSNEANHRGATDLGTQGTKPSASQQQGQGSWNATGTSNRKGSEKDESGGQGGENKTGE